MIVNNETVADVRATTEKSSAVGNAAAMREALVNASMVLAKWRLDAPVSAWNEYCEAIDRCRAAIAKPPRNCDVGTAEEQYSRMFRECYEWMCRDCKLRDKDFRKCAISWAQKPYEEGGAK